MTSILEKVATFGASRGLVGILTLPAEAPARRAPHVILLNAGIIHRVGSNRLSVTLARALGVAGITSLRFDLSGIGDSERRRDAGSLRESVERDIADAIAHLSATQGAVRVVLMGLCSGAYDAFHAALGESRVVGAVLVDMPGPFQGWRHTLHHIKGRLLNPSSWSDPVQKALHYSRLLLGAPRTRRDDDEGYVLGGRSSVSRSRERMRHELQNLLERGARLLVVFTSGIEANYNHRSQFRATFPRAARHPAVSYEFFPDSDHDFSSARTRSRLVDLIVRWVAGQTFADPAA